MCGRFTLRLPPAELAEMFQVLREIETVPRYNIAPTQQIAAVRSNDGHRELTMLKWGLIPSWSKDDKIGARLINARGETVSEKPSFRAAFKRRRCLIPADGFYEWKKLSGKSKQPYLIGMKDEAPFAFAGLWEHWGKGADGSIESCTIITTTPNELLADIHDRMPIILPVDHWDVWLDHEITEAAALQSLLIPLPAEVMQRVPVSTLVNSPRNDIPECTEVIETDDRDDA